jgi:hypothetical protein
MVRAKGKAAKSANKPCGTPRRDLCDLARWNVLLFRLSFVMFLWYISDMSRLQS